MLSDNLARLQGEVSAFMEQLADSHQDWGTDKGGNPQTAVTSGTPQAQKPEGNSPPHLYLPCIPVDAVSGQRSRSDTFSFGLNAWQFKRNRSMSDNDLKYRTILMMGSAQTQYLDTLETIFEYSRDLKRIRALRLQVQDYEYRVKAPRSETRTDATPGRRNRRTGVKNTVKNSYVVLICLCILLVLYLIKIIGYE